MSRETVKFLSLMILITFMRMTKNNQFDHFIRSPTNTFVQRTGRIYILKTADIEEALLSIQRHSEDVLKDDETLRRAVKEYFSPAEIDTPTLHSCFSMLSYDSHCGEVALAWLKSYLLFNDPIEIGHDMISRARAFSEILSISMELSLEFLVEVIKESVEDFAQFVQKTESNDS